MGRHFTRFCRFVFIQPQKYRCSLRNSGVQSVFQFILQVFSGVELCAEHNIPHQRQQQVYSHITRYYTIWYVFNAITYCINKCNARVYFILSNWSTGENLSQTAKYIHSTLIQCQKGWFKCRHLYCVFPLSSLHLCDGSDSLI